MEPHANIIHRIYTVELEYISVIESYMPCLPAGSLHARKISCHCLHSEIEL